MYVNINNEYKIIKALSRLEKHQLVVSSLYFILFVASGIISTLSYGLNVLFTCILFFQCVIVLFIRIKTHYHFSETLEPDIKNKIKKIVYFNIFLWSVLVWSSIFLLDYLSYTDDFKIVCSVSSLPSIYYFLILIISIF